MGQIAANKTNQELELVIDEYYNTLLLLLSKKMRYSNSINAHN